MLPTITKASVKQRILSTIRVIANNPAIIASFVGALVVFELDTIGDLLHDMNALIYADMMLQMDGHY